MLVEKTKDGFRATVPCKVNLFLDVLGRRSDGYHDLDTLMLGVSLCDQLIIQPVGGDRLELVVSVPEGADQKLQADDPAWTIPNDRSNLVVRSLEVLRTALGLPRAGASLRLTKRIPAMAGLGGGSADAAAALVLGSLLWTGRVDWSLVHRLASELGSDINFFLEGNRDSYWLARCTGRGERITPLPCGRTLHLVILHPPAGCKTADVFSNFGRQKGAQSSVGLQDCTSGSNGDSSRVAASHRDEASHRNDDRVDASAKSADSMAIALRNGDASNVGKMLHNALETAAAATTDWIGRSSKCFDRYDHLGQCLSGSGSARFCLCSDALQAENIVNALRIQGDMRVYYAQSWRSPSIDSQIKQLRNQS